MGGVNDGRPLKRDDAGRPSLFEMLGRLRWSVRGLLPPTSPVVMAQAFAYLYGIGATLALVSLLFPHDPDRWVPGIVAPALIAYGVATLMVVGFERIPLWLFRLLPGLGALLITSLVYSGGADAATAYATIYFWAVLSAYYFFELRHALVTLLVCFAGFAAAMAARGDQADPALNWILLATTLTVAGFLIALLRQRSERLVALLGEAQGVAHIGSWEWHIPSDELAWSDELYRIHGLPPGGFPSSYDDLISHAHPEDRPPSTASSARRSRTTRRSCSSTASSAPTASCASCTGAGRSRPTTAASPCACSAPSRTSPSSAARRNSSATSSSRLRTRW